MRHAFTLIELLVVVAIIALLIGILLPALSGAMSVVRTSKCLSNLKQIEMAHQLYMNDNDDAFIDAALPHGGIGHPSKSWLVNLSSYYNTPFVVHSPVDHSTLWPTDDGGVDDRMSLSQFFAFYNEHLNEFTDDDPNNDPTIPDRARWTSYGLNNFTARNVAPTGYNDPVTGKRFRYDRYDALYKILRPAQTVHFLIMAYEGDFGRSDHVHAEAWSDGPPGSAPVIASGETQIGAHGGPSASDQSISNYAFLDGHAQTMRFKEVYTDTLHNRFHPEATP